MTRLAAIAAAVLVTFCPALGHHDGGRPIVAHPHTRCEAIRVCEHGRSGR